MIDHSTIQRVLDSTNIVDVVQEFVSLKRAGKDYKGLCPFHGEKTPSFVVSPAKGICKCFSCGEGGDAVRFLMKIEQITYPEAIKWLGRKYGIEVVDKQQTDEEKKAATERESLFVVNEWAQNYFENLLHNHVDGIAVGLSYFRARGLRDDTIRHYHLGFSLSQRSALAEHAIARGFLKDNLLKTGLCFATEDNKIMDKYRGRVIFPVHTVSGKVVAFGGRILSGDKKLAKYINSPESEIYSKSRELYGLFQAKKAISKEDKCYLVEGYMDVLSMYQSGLENVVASSGTALTKGQIRLINRFSRNITVLYDGDAAGIHASLRGIDMLLEEGMRVKALLLPNGEDPDSFVRSHSPEEFRKYIVDNEVDFLTFKSNLLMKDIASDPIKRSEAIKEIIHSVSIVPEGIARQSYAHALAGITQMDEKLLLYEISKTRKLYLQNEETHQDSLLDKQEQSPLLVDAASKQKSSSLVEKAELNLVQQLIRHAEKYIHFPSTDYEDAFDIKVGELVLCELKNDGLSFTNATYQLILDEVSQHIEDEKFHALHYFLHHSNPTVHNLAVSLAYDTVQLSSSQQEQYGQEDDHLLDIVPRLINDLKYAILRRREAQLLDMIKEVGNNHEALKELMEKLLQIKSVIEQFSKATGYKVLTI